MKLSTQVYTSTKKNKFRFLAITFIAIVIASSFIFNVGAYLSTGFPVDESKWVSSTRYYHAFNIPITIMDANGNELSSGEEAVVIVDTFSYYKYDGLADLNNTLGGVYGPGIPIHDIYGNGHTLNYYIFFPIGLKMGVNYWETFSPMFQLINVNTISGSNSKRALNYLNNDRFWYSETPGHTEVIPFAGEGRPSDQYIYYTTFQDSIKDYNTNTNIQFGAPYLRLQYHPLVNRLAVYTDYAAELDLFDGSMYSAVQVTVGAPYLLDSNIMTRQEALLLNNLFDGLNPSGSYNTPTVTDAQVLSAWLNLSCDVGYDYYNWLLDNGYYDSLYAIDLRYLNLKDREGKPADFAHEFIFQTNVQITDEDIFQDEVLNHFFKTEEAIAKFMESFEGLTPEQKAFIAEWKADINTYSANINFGSDFLEYQEEVYGKDITGFITNIFTLNLDSSVIELFHTFFSTFIVRYIFYIVIVLAGASILLFGR